MGVADPVQVVHVGAGLQAVHRAHGGQAQPTLIRPRDGEVLKRGQLEASRAEFWKLAVPKSLVEAWQPEFWFLFVCF